MAHSYVNSCKSKNQFNVPRNTCGILGTKTDSYVVTLLCETGTYFTYTYNLMARFFFSFFSPVCNCHNVKMTFLALILLKIVICCYVLLSRQKKHRVLSIIENR